MVLWYLLVPAGVWSARSQLQADPTCISSCSSCWLTQLQYGTEPPVATAMLHRDEVRIMSTLHKFRISPETEHNDRGQQGKQCSPVMSVQAVDLPELMRALGGRLS